MSGTEWTEPGQGATVGDFLVCGPKRNRPLNCWFCGRRIEPLTEDLVNERYLREEHDAFFAYPYQDSDTRAPFHGICLADYESGRSER